MKRLPSLRQAWFQLHWFLGVTAGTVLIVIGLSGAALSFREEIVDLVTPGGRHVPVAGAPLAAPALAEALAQRHGQRQIGSARSSCSPNPAMRHG
jgi:sulfite reductase (NADPH) flavoprotein alpha-component